MLSSRLKFSLAIRKNNYSNAQKARIYWQKVSNVIEENNKNQSNINNTCKIDKNKILKEVKEKVKEENIGDDGNDYGWRNLKNKIFSKFKRSDKE